METLPDNKRENVVKKIKKAVNTRWLSLHASVDGVDEEYVGLLETFCVLEPEGGSGGSMAKSPKFTGMLYTLRVVLPSLKLMSAIFHYF